MIHIILGILKITGIILLILLGILLFLLLSVLFVPIQYRALAKKDEEMEAKVKVSWLFHLLHVTFHYTTGEEEMAFRIRLFGIPLDVIGKAFSKVKGFFVKEKTAEEDSKQELPKQKEDLKTAEEVSKDKNPETGRSVEKAIKEQKEVKKEPKKEPKKKQKKKSGKTETKAGLTKKGFYDTIKDIKAFVTSDEFKGSIRFLWIQIKYLCRAILPKKITGELHFGFEDPGMTGELLGAAAVLYPVYADSLTIVPYFDRQILKGNIRVKGHITGVVFLWVAWKLYRNSDIRYIIKRFKTKEV